MGALIRAHDWASTPLGPIEAWPQSLRAAAGLMLGIRHPMVLWWGPELIQLYNDAHRETLDPETHPAVLGIPGQQGWADLWHIIGPQIEAVMAGQGATRHVDQLLPITRQGQRRDTWWTYSISPVADDEAATGVGGVIVVCRETTRVVLERRRSEARYRALFDSMDQGFCVIEMLLDEHGRPADYAFLETNEVFERQTGLRDVLGRRARDLVPDLESFWIETYGRVALTGKPIRFANHTQAMGRWFDVNAFRIGEPGAHHVAVLFSDITARKDAEARLRAMETRQGFLLRLGDTLAPLADAAEIQAEACRLLGEHLSVAQVGFGELNEAGTHVAVHRDWTDGRIPSVAGLWLLDDFGPNFAAALHRGETVAIPDITLDPRTSEPGTAASFAAIGVQAILDVPRIRNGRLATMLFIHEPAPREWQPAELALVDETCDRLWAAVERARAEHRLRESEERLRLIVENVHDYAIFTTDPDYCIDTWLPGAAAVFGWTSGEALGQSAALLYTAEDRARGIPAEELETARQEGTAPNIRWHLRQDGTRVFIEGSVTALRHADGTVRGFLKIGQDVTERRAAEHRQALLAREVDHRAKNALAVVQTALRLTPREDPAAYAAAVEGRVGALARAQTLLAEERWSGAALHAILRGELAPFLSGQRADLDGPPVVLPAGMAQPLAMAIHELATNALKYGALSVPTGRVSVSWHLAGPPPGLLCLRWAENGGPPVAETPTRRGFGSRVLEGTVRRQLGGAVLLRWNATGLVCEVEVPLGPAATTPRPEAMPAPIAQAHH
ncbi:PAS domain S-box protein [Roseomonas sp. WA12]